MIFMKKVKKEYYYSNGNCHFFFHQVESFFCGER